MTETTMTMKDFELDNKMGQITNKEDERVYIEKANAKAALRIIAAKKARKESAVNTDVQDYIGKVRDVIKNDAIPLEIYEEHFNDRIKALKDREYKFLRKKDAQKGFLAKTDEKTLGEIVEAIKEVEGEKDRWLNNEKGKANVKNNKADNKQPANQNITDS